MDLIIPYGYGWVAETGEYGEEMWHDGKTIGFACFNIIFVEQNAQLIILTNNVSQDLITIKNNIINILNGNAVEVIMVSEDQLDKYAGTYEIEGIGKVDIFVKDGILMLQVENQPALGLNPLSETRFDIKMLDVLVEFNSKDEPTEFMLYQMGYEFTAVKLK